MFDCFEKCNICPRKCGVSRNEGVGFCNSPSDVRIARASRHMWEEPSISGVRGSGTIFFSGCNLKCVFCQNHDISRGNKGIILSESELEKLILKMNESDVHNINLVTPTHYLPTLIKVILKIKPRLSKPIVYNCSGYENPSLLKETRGIIDIFLTDFKYKSHELSKKYSCCEDYYDVAIASLEVMLDIAPEIKFDSDVMTSGVIVRHLVLPSHKNDSIEIIEDLYERFGTDKFLLSLMSQFTPNEECKNFPEISRTLTSLEYSRVCRVAEELLFKGYMQDKSAAKKEYIPDFDDFGEFLSCIK